MQTFIFLEVQINNDCMQSYCVFFYFSLNVFFFFSLFPSAIMSSEHVKSFSTNSVHLIVQFVLPYMVARTSRSNKTSINLTKVLFRFISG